MFQRDLTGCEGCLVQAGMSALLRGDEKTLHHGLCMQCGPQCSPVLKLTFTKFTTQRLAMLQIAVQARQHADSRAM